MDIGKMRMAVTMSREQERSRQVTDVVHPGQGGMGGKEVGPYRRFRQAVFNWALLL